MRKGMVLLTVGALGMVLALSGASAATVLRGSSLVALSTSCAGTPGCVAWVAGGCRPQGVVANGVDYSAVDVSALVGRTGVFSPTSPLASRVGGDSAWVQFVTAQCRLLLPVQGVGLGQNRSLTVPLTAKWMTVGGYWATSHALSWTYTFA